MRFASGHDPSEYTPFKETPPSAAAGWGAQVTLSALIWSAVRPADSAQNVNEEVIVPNEMVSVYVQDAEPGVDPLPPGPVPPVVLPPQLTRSKRADPTHVVMTMIELNPRTRHLARNST
jgi:hypothetical protein